MTQGNWLKLKLKKLDTPFVRNVGWMGGARAVTKITRLMATVVLARVLTAHDYGLAAIVLTSNELVQVFTRNGIGSRLIIVDESELPILAQSAYCLSWVIFIGLFIIQCLAAFPLAWFYDDNQIILPICAMALNLLLIPNGIIQAALIQRENRLRVIAIAEMCQICTDNFLSLFFALAGLGMWAIILPKILVVPIWLYLIIKNHSWRPKFKFSTERWRELFRFGRSVLGGELLNTFRYNLDYLIVGRFLSIEALGIYYFAFNAGLGISQSIIFSIKSALFPHLCEAKANFDQFKSRYFSSLKTIALIIVPFVLFQSSFAPLYVPIVFGEKWIAAIPVLILICLSAIPRPFADSASQLLLSVDKPEINLAWNVLFTGLFTIGLLIGVQWQSLGVAIAVVITHFVFLPLFTVWATRYVFKRLS